jgi:hypothetical protein
MAAGVLAYVAETLTHEAVGHGGVCVASGLRFEVLAPLWMRCSETSAVVNAAGPAANVIAAAILAAWLMLAPVSRAGTGLLVWLGFSFNALVACGYLAVGALTGFGDWPALFASVRPVWAWAVPSVIVAVAGYVACLYLAAGLFRRFSGAGERAARRLWRRAMAAGVGAAIVACMAEIAGGRVQPMPLALALGCTVVVGYSLTSMDRVVERPGLGRDLGPISRNWWVIGGGLIVGLAFCVIVGPGLVIMR